LGGGDRGELSGRGGGQWRPLLPFEPPPGAPETRPLFPLFEGLEPAPVFVVGALPPLPGRSTLAWPAPGPGAPGPGAPGPGAPGPGGAGADAGLLPAEAPKPCGSVAVTVETLPRRGAASRCALSGVDDDEVDPVARPPLAPLEPCDASDDVSREVDAMGARG